MFPCRRTTRFFFPHAEQQNWLKSPCSLHVNLVSALVLLAGSQSNLSCVTLFTLFIWLIGIECPKQWANSMPTMKRLLFAVIVPHVFEQHLINLVLTVLHIWPLWLRLVGRCHLVIKEHFNDKEEIKPLTFTTISSSSLYLFTTFPCI